MKGEADDEYGTVTARFYDETYAALGNVGPDAAFYRALAAECGGPVLELGCGTGRVLLDIASDGLGCTGIDLSEHMLEACRAKASGRGLDVELIAAPMQSFDLPGRRYAFVYSAFRAFQHLYTVEDQLACLACVRRHLEPGGVLAFDVFRPRLARMAVLEEPEVEDVRFSPRGVRGEGEVVRYASVQRDNVRQLMDVRFRYVETRPGSEPSEEVVSFRMRWFLQYELEHLMHRAGFEDVRIYGDFDGSEVNGDCPAYVVVAS